MALPRGFDRHCGHRHSICILACCIAGSLRMGVEAGRQGKDPLFFYGDTELARGGEDQEEELWRRSRRRKKTEEMSVSEAFLGMKALLYEDGNADATTAAVAATTMMKKKKKKKRVCRKREMEQQKTLVMACPNPNCSSSSSSLQLFLPNGRDEQLPLPQQRSEWLMDGKIPLITNSARRNPSCFCCGSSLQFSPFNGDEKQQQKQQRGEDNDDENDALEWPMECPQAQILSMMNRACPNHSSSLQLFLFDNRDERQMQQKQQRGLSGEESEWLMEPRHGKIPLMVENVCQNPKFCGSSLKFFPLSRDEQQQRGGDASEQTVESLQGGLIKSMSGDPSFASSLQLFPISRDKQQSGEGASEWQTEFLQGQIPSMEKDGKNPSFAASLQFLPPSRDEQKRGGNMSEGTTESLLGQIPLVNRTQRSPSSMQLFPLNRDKQQRGEDVSEWLTESLQGQIPSINRDGRNPSFACSSQLFLSGRDEQQQRGEEAPEWLKEPCQGKILSMNKVIPFVRDERNPNQGSPFPLELFPVTSSRDGLSVDSLHLFGSSSTSQIERETEEEKGYFLSSIRAHRSPKYSSSFELFPSDRDAVLGSSQGIEHRREKGSLEWPMNRETKLNQELTLGRVSGISNCSSTLKVFLFNRDEDSDSGWGMKREKELDQGQVIMGRANGGISNCSSSSMEISPINGDDSDEVSKSGGRIKHQGGKEYALDWPMKREMERECNQGQSGISNNSSSSEVFLINGDDRVLDSSGIEYQREETEFDQGQLTIGRASRNHSSSSSSSSSSSLSESSSSSLESAIIPGLNEDTASRCIALVTRSAYSMLSRTSNGLWQLIRTGRIFKLRREMGVKEPWIYMYAQGGSGDPMMMVAGDSASPWRAFDPSERKWLTLPPSPADFSFLMSDKESLAAGTHLLWMGHDILGYSIFRYDLVSHTWARGPSMNSARCLFASASSSIYGYVAGGNLDGVLLKSAERYNSELEQWEQLPDMNHARHNASGCYMDGKFYVIGGCDSKWKPLEKSEVFDPVLGTWTEIPSMLPEPPSAELGSRSHCSAPPLIAVVNDNLYSIDLVQNAIQIYQKADNTWHTLGLAPLRTDRNFGWGLAFKGVGDNLIVIGGYQNPKGARGLAIFAWNPVLAGGNRPEWTMLTFMLGGFSSFLCNCAVMSC